MDLQKIKKNKIPKIEETMCGLLFSIELKLAEKKILCFVEFFPVSSGRISKYLQGQKKKIENRN